MVRRHDRDPDPFKASSTWPTSRTCSPGASPGSPSASTPTQSWAKAAIQTEFALRGGAVAELIFHSDRGSTYTADLFTEACEHHKIRQSMGRIGSCLDNAAAESFFSTLGHELLSRTPFRAKEEARRRVANWIDDHNRRRRHTVCGMKFSIDYEPVTTVTDRAA